MWLAHIANTLASQQDAHGSAINGIFMATCAGLQLYEVTIEQGSEHGRKIPLKADQIGTADMAELQVSVDKTFVPMQITGGASKDPRELGVRVFHAFIQPAG